MKMLTAPTCEVFHGSPEKANIFYYVKDSFYRGVGQKHNNNNYYNINGCSRKTDAFRKMLIFCRRCEDCYWFYCSFKAILGKRFTFPEGAPNIPQYRVINMFTHTVHKLPLKTIIIINELVKPNGTL